MRRLLAALVACAAIVVAAVTTAGTPAQAVPQVVARGSLPALASAVLPRADEPAPMAAGGGDPTADVLAAGTRLELELAYAQGFRESADLRGYIPSLYRGRWFMPKREHVRRCIAQRESHQHYGAVSVGGKYRGAYQMSRALGIGATWMMQPDVEREMGDLGVGILRQLRETPINQWNRYWQDRAFWTIYRKGKGARHWQNGAYACPVRTHKRR